MTVMIDWVTARLPFASAGVINGGVIISIDGDGLVEYRTDKWFRARGSYDASIGIRGGNGEVMLSGNPSKFLQGHNLFGSGELVPLVARTMQRIAYTMGIVPTVQDYRAWLSGDYSVSRVDIARMVDCGSPERVRKVLTALGQSSRRKYQPASVTGSGTVYIGKGSRRHELKFYDKAYELQQRGHQLSATLAPIWHRWLSDWVVGKLRVEVKLGSKEIHESPQLRHAGNWNVGLAESLLNRELATLEVSDTMRLPDDVVQNLPPKLVAIYDAWRAGRDLRALYSKPTFYRYRKQLLPYGIDIAHVQLRAVVSETQYVAGFPLRELLQSPGVPVPDWAISRGLLAS